MENFEPKPRRVIKIPLKKIIGIVVLGAILVFVYNEYFNHGYDFSMSIGNNSVQNMPNVPSMTETSKGMPDMYRQRYEQTDITDTREFLKTNYSGVLKTRDVSEVVKDVKGAVREFKGRIDSENTSEKYGYISFVVPKDTFESFRSEIESITHEKLYIESISSQNLLGEKQYIEEQMNYATSSLAELEGEKVNLDARHIESLNSIQNKLTNIRNQVTAIQTQAQKMEEGDQLTILKNSERSLLDQVMVLQQSLERENATYYARNQNLVSYINQAKGVVLNVETQDSNFMGNIETVNGHIEVRWISIWGLAETFSPVHPTIVIVVLLLAIWFFLNRKGYTPKFEFV